MALTDGNIIIGTSVDVGGINSALYKINGSFKKLGKSITLNALGVGALVALGKAALDAASDLQEIQNVVDVSFTKMDDAGNIIEDMTGKIEGFSQVAIEQYGMSELAAKQTAGSFMAMGKSMGLTMEEASDMSVSLTALTGDFASFYNISQDYAKVAMSAVYTGETETLKRYGIVLTEANLQQFAINEGIDANVKKMNARDKAILRYKYIMKATADMQGDFVRTQGSWANQMKVLQQVWNQFMITVGNGLITIFTPLLQVLNGIVKKMIEFTKVLWVILGNIFGVNFTPMADSVGGVADGFDVAAEEAEDFGDAVETAGKKTKKALMPFDELNNIITPDKSSSSGTLANMMDLGDIDLGEFEDLQKKVEKITSDINTLYGLGKFIGDKLASMMESIDWKRVYEGAKNFGKGLADFLNGLISTDLFKDVGKTIAGALNTAIYTALSFAENFDFVQLGMKLAEGINNFFYDFDFEALGRAIRAWALGFWAFMYNLLKNLDWGQIFKAVKDFFSGLGVDGLIAVLGFITLKKLISAGILKAFTEGIKKGLGLVPLKTLFKDFGVSLAKGLKFQLQYAAASIQVIFEDLGKGMTLNQTFLHEFGKLNTVIAGITAVIGGTVLAVKEFFDMWTNGWSALKTILEAIGIAIAAIGAVILGASAAVVAPIAAAVFLVSQAIIVLKQNWSDVVELFKIIGESIADVFKNIGTWIAGIGTSIADFFKGIGNWFVESGQKVIDWVVGIKDSVLGIFASVSEAIYSFFEPIITTLTTIFTNISNFIEGVVLRIGQVIEGIFILMQAGFMLMGQFLTETVFPAIQNFINMVLEIVTTMWETFKTNCIEVFTWINEVIIQPLIEMVVGTVQNIIATITNAVQGVIMLLTELWTNIQAILIPVFEWFNTTIIQPIQNAISALGTAVQTIFTTMWENFKNGWTTTFNWLTTSIIQPMVSAFTDAIDGLGMMFEALWDKVTEGAKNAFNGLISFFESVINFFIDGANDFLEGFSSVVADAAELVGINWGGVTPIPRLTLPRLAQGAVIPPNNEFMAILGDQKHGTNIEAPLDTIKQAVAEVLAGMGGMSSGSDQPIVVQIDGREVFRAVRKQNDMFKKSTGVSGL